MSAGQRSLVFSLSVYREEAIVWSLLLVFRGNLRIPYVLKEVALASPTFTGVYKA
jgi:hypothetical protein